MPGMGAPLKCIALGLLGLLHCGAPSAQDIEASLEQLNHRAYGIFDGAPAEVRAFAQTPDGTLWLGSRKGLSRFDGVRFVSYPGTSDEPLPSTAISALLSSPDGGLWIGFHFGGIGFLKAGHLTQYTERDGLPGGTVNEIVRDRDGALWVAANGGIGRLQDGRCERVASEAIERGRSLALDRTGALWVLTRDRVLVRLSGETAFREMAKVEVTDERLPGALAASPDGPVWASVPSVTLVFPGSQENRAPLRIKGTFVPMFFDEDANLWANGRALYRWSRSRLLPERLSATLADIEEHSDPTGARNDIDSPRRLFHDREGNVWVARSSGIDRYSRGSVTRVSLPPCAGIPNALTRGDAATFWSVCEGKSSPFVLMKIHNGSIVSERETDKWFSAGYRAPDGSVWLGGAAWLGHVEGDRLVTMPIPQEARGLDVQAIVGDHDGALWVSMVQKGVFRVVAGQWSAGGGFDALKRLGYAVVETADSEGNLWFGYPNSRIARLQNGAVRLFDAAQGLSVGNVESIYVTGAHLWAGGELGLARFDGARFIQILSAARTGFTGISGIVATQDGDLWLNGNEGITRIQHEEIERATQDANYRVQSRTFDYLDGLPGTAVQVRTIPSAIGFENGQLLFEMTRGLVLIDSKHLIRNMLAPQVRIWSVNTDERQYSNLGSDVRLPVDTTRLVFNYSAGSLTVPEHMRFRYKLEGSDRDWQDGENRRDARYTNLTPGRYTFRVTASNNDGIWNTTGATLNFEIPPAFYQTKWFYALCSLLFLALLFGLYRARLLQVAAQIRGRMEAQLSERERIARDLHDTLLQSFQGSLLRFQTVRDLLPKRPAEAEKVLDSAIDQAAHAITEGRQALQGLRSSPAETSDLASSIRTLGEAAAEETGKDSVALRVETEGTPRALSPVLRDEICRIAGEALRNAFRHAESSQIEVEVRYDKRQLRLQIRDNGKGIDPRFLSAAPVSGHYGLHGMRERAQLMGGELAIWSSPSSGTELELTIPASRVYSNSPSNPRPYSLSRSY